MQPNQFLSSSAYLLTNGPSPAERRGPRKLKKDKSNKLRISTMDWSDNHRYFMQYVMSYRMIEKTQLQKIHEKIFGEEQNFQATLDLIDTKIPKLGLRLVQKNCESDGLLYLILIPLWYQDTVISLNTYSEPQLNMFKSIVHKIIEDGEISVAECLHLAGDKLSLKDANDTLVSFINAKYFLQIDDNIRLSILGILELEPYFKKYFSELLKQCNLCKSGVFYGTSCECGQYYHGYCLDRYRTARGSSDSCPTCST
ncbi:hypothetical protein M8J77_003502 [Diaphorina citri]|nr:hypothetical protein M8J77_003502 [Diaphorina citri]